MGGGSRIIAGAFLALSLVLAGTPAGGGTSSPQAVDWPNLPYYDYREDGQHFFYIPTNAEMFTAYLVTGTATGFDFDARTPEQNTGGRYLEAIWKPKCPKVDEQKMTQTREVYLPGAASKLLVNLRVDVPSLSSHKNKNPIKFAEVYVNKTLVARIEKNATPGQWMQIDATAQAATMEFGLNTIKIVAVKRKTKKGWNYCWNQGKADFGIAAEIYGELTSDMTSHVAEGSGAGTTREFDSSVTVNNLGPSGAALPYFNLVAENQIGSALTEVTLSGPGATCSTVTTENGFSASCNLPDIKAGDSFVLNFHVEWEAEDCPYRMPYYYYATSRWNDPNAANSGEQTRAISCGA